MLPRQRCAAPALVMKLITLHLSAPALVVEHIAPVPVVCAAPASTTIEAPSLASPISAVMKIGAGDRV